MNGARLETDVTQEDPGIFLPDRLYTVTVDNDISGNSPDTLTLVQPEGSFWKPGGDATKADWLAEQPVAHPGYA